MRYVQLTGTGDLLELSRRMRAAGGPRLRQNMSRRVRRAAEPLHRDLQTAIATLPISSQGGRSRGGPSPTSRPLRATIAAAIRISVRTGAAPGARVWIDRAALPADLREMPAALNRGRVRHPVFGNRRRWTQQTAPPLWWDRTVRQHMPRMQTEVTRVLDDVRRQLE
ncbi:hypothetical protein [Streptomyces uncialis]|uniref:hypothetical protein n=1 Tax=Streptomyces uncialis TaxID=1048205 RepID=UPI00386715CD|nr:hypothetical protein OG924_12600 [Streptomyces uncialis]